MISRELNVATLMNDKVVKNRKCIFNEIHDMDFDNEQSVSDREACTVEQLSKLLNAR